MRFIKAAAVAAVVTAIATASQMSPAMAVTVPHCGANQHAVYVNNVVGFVCVSNL